jgi:hypothetical protein
MLVINSRQMAAMGNARREDFERSVVRHLLSTYPRESRQAGGEEQMRLFVRKAVKKALSHGYETERQIALYVSLALILGSGFDTDPQLPWAGAAVDDRALLDLTERVEALYDLTLDYLGAVAGEKGERVVRALLRIRRYDLSSAPDEFGAALVDALCKVLQGFWPEKLDHQGLEATRVMAEDGIGRAQNFGLGSPEGLVLFVTLQFMLGHAFYEDPLHPWAERILNHGALSGDVKTKLLYDAAMTHLGQSLTDNAPSEDEA